MRNVFLILVCLSFLTLMTSCGGSVGSCDCEPCDSNDSPTAQISTPSDGSTYTWQEAQDVFIAKLNNDNFGGYANWRLPTVKELSVLVHADAFSPAINTAYFPQTMSSDYWSSTTWAGNKDYRLLVHFDRGSVFSSDKSDSYYVRAVRGGQ